jgi:hypothetical protein
MAEIINLADYHKICTWIAVDKNTGEFFVVYENETAGEHSIDGPYDTAEDAERALEAFADRTNAIRQDVDETMQ